MCADAAQDAQTRVACPTAVAKVFMRTDTELFQCLAKIEVGLVNELNVKTRHITNVQVVAVNWIFSFRIKCVGLEVIFGPHQVWRSGRLEDDVPSRVWHDFLLPCLGSSTYVLLFNVSFFVLFSH